MTLAELRALCERATKGPWIVADYLQQGDAVMALQAGGHQRQHICYASGLSSVIDDLPFIAAARTWLPALIEKLIEWEPEDYELWAAIVEKDASLFQLAEWLRAIAALARLDEVGR